MSEQELHFPAYSALRVDLDQHVEWMQPQCEELWNRILINRDGVVPSCVAVASLTEGDGATTIAASLAAYLARGLGRRPIVIECDLREPNYSKIGLAPEECPGLGALVRGEADFLDLVYRIPLLDFHAMPAGAPVVSPSAMLVPEAIRKVVERATALFDTVILDTPALNTAPEARHIVSTADTTVPILRSGRTVPEKAAYWLAKIAEYGGNVGAMALNEVPTPLPTRIRSWLG